MNMFVDGKWSKKIGPGYYEFCSVYLVLFKRKILVRHKYSSLREMDDMR